MLPIHKEINKKLDVFIEKNRVPHIIFHGPYGSGKKTIVRNFLKKIYRNEESNLKDYVMYVDCAQGKGIKFVREDIKFFAKTNIKNDLFKSIVFLNTDKLTMDAQSALRRCIELFSHSTRFFIILEDKYKLLKPISSRFCEFYIGMPNIKNKTISLHEENINNIYTDTCTKKRLEYVQKNINQINKKKEKGEPLQLCEIVEKFYEKGISGLDIIKIIEKTRIINESEKIEYLFLFNDAKKEFRCEKTFMMFMLTILFLRNNRSLENITFM